MFNVKDTGRDMYRYAIEFRNKTLLSTKYPQNLNFTQDILKCANNQYEICTFVQDSRKYTFEKFSFTPLNPGQSFNLCNNGFKGVKGNVSQHASKMMAKTKCIIFIGKTEALFVETVCVWTQPYVVMQDLNLRTMQFLSHMQKSLIMLCLVCMHGTLHNSLYPNPTFTTRKVVYLYPPSAKNTNI